MRRMRWALVGVVSGLVALVGHPRAQVASSVIYGTGGITFYGVGDLGGGGVNSIVQEATQIGSTVYAVGASTQTAVNAPIPNLDTAVVWDSASNALTIVPDLAFFMPPLPTSANSVIYALTSDAQYIAGRLRNNAANSGTSNGFKSFRVLGGLRAVGAFTALDISDDATANILYGQQSGGTATVNNSRAVRFDVSGAITSSVPVPLLTPAAIAAGGPCSSSAPTCLDNLPAYRGMSEDGSVLVGTAFTGGFTGLQNQYQTTNGLAFRWRFNEPAVTEIPRPTGGTWSSAIAISPNGKLTLAGGNSDQYPLGEVWIHDAKDDTTDADDTMTELGSPNTAFSPRLYGGMTADGSVVGVTFMGAAVTQSPTLQNNPVQYAYLHNSHGWFHLANVLTAQGVDLWANGWNPANMILTGIRTVDTDNNGAADVDLVFGQGRRHNANGSAGAPEGFVVSFPVGVLANYQLPEPADVENRALVGAWAIGPDSNDPLSVLVFTTEGSYYSISKATLQLGIIGVEFERGVYTLTDANGLTFTTTRDRDGAGPPLNTTPPFVVNGFVSALNGRLSLSAEFTSADTFEIQDTSCSPVCTIVQATRIAGGAGSIVGGWIGNDVFFLDGGTLVIVFLDSSAGFKYFMAGDGESNVGSETGTYEWDPITHALELTEEFGSPDGDTTTATFTRDELGLHVVSTEPNGEVNTIDVTRIVNPSTVLPSITNETLEASGAEDSAFSYTVTAVNALSFEASGLPAGLTIDENTGVISGTPAVNGTFNVTITVTNSLGDTDVETLVLTFGAPPTSFRGIGDLPGGSIGSAVRDATRVNGTLYAVGASVQRVQANLCNNFTPNDPVAGCIVFPLLDSPVLWTDAGTGIPSLVPLPEAMHTTSPPTNGTTAHAITPTAQYIASQYHATANSTVLSGVRVTNADGTLTNQATGPGFVNWAISNDGTVIYGHRGPGSNLIQATRHVFNGATFTVTDVPFPSGAATTASQPSPHGTTTDGNTMVGVASMGTLAKSNGVAFRYKQATGVSTPIPMHPTGGTWNYPIAVSGDDDGAVTAVAGNSTSSPNGEIYLVNAANVITSYLGSPSVALSPYIFGGMTSDGSVVAVTFGNIGSTNNPSVLPNGGRYAYFHNAHGWFHLSSLLASQGINLAADGWDPTNMAVTGIRTLEGVDLVFGQGRRRTPGATGYLNGALEGFVVELPAGTLAAFNPTPTPPADQALVGAWLVGADLTNPNVLVSFMADGTFVRMNIGATTGIERGLYSWAGNDAGGEIVITTLYDTDGTFGGSFRNGQRGVTQIVTGDTFTFVDTNCPGCATTTGTRVTGSPGSIVGGWIDPYPTSANFVTAVLTGSSGGNKYYFFEHGDEGDGFEIGTYSWDPVTRLFMDIGNPGTSTVTATLSRDELGLSVVETEFDGDVFTTNLTRIVAPSTVQPTFFGTLDVDGTVGFAFSFTPQTSWTSSFSAVNLPPGLVIDASSGEISGTPTTAGVYLVTVTAGNSFGLSTDGTLTITVNAPAIIVVPPGDDVMVEPEVPEGTPPVELTFDTVVAGGETTVAVIDPETTPELAPEPPGNFSIVTTEDGVPLYYDIRTTADFGGAPVMICFSYAGIDFGGETPRLFHYENNQWVDITSSVDEATQTLCGTTTSFSPFAIFKSVAPFVSATGFYAPVSPLTGFVNTVKAGSTVPLRFNVTINGVEKTDTSYLFFSTTQVAASMCTASPQDQVDFVTVGETNLRYDTDGHQFIQNWKLPQTTGCVIARITYHKEGEQEVVLASAVFSLK